MTNNQYKDKDAFNREDFIISIEKDLESIREKEGGVVAIHASFGMGKTFFCNIYKDYLKSQENHNACIIDAHLHDYVDDPFIPINQAICGLISNEESKSKKFKEAAIKHFKKAAIKLGSELLLGPVASLLPKCLAKLLDKLIGSVVVEWLEPKNSLEKIKKEYIKALTELIKETQLTIFIDDLDRCRPDYALKFLERLKHYFNQVPGLLFVLMIDQDQIYSSIEHEYGAKDPHRYFEKFLSTSIIDLPDEKSQWQMRNFTSSLIKIKKPEIKNEDLIGNLVFYFDVTKCNHRVKEKILKSETYLKVENNSAFRRFPYEHRVLLRALKDSMPDIFNKLKIKDQDGYLKVYELLEKGKSQLDSDDFCVMVNFYEVISYEGEEKEKRKLLEDFKYQIGDDFKNFVRYDHESYQQYIENMKIYVEFACKAIN